MEGQIKKFPMEAQSQKGALAQITINIFFYERTMTKKIGMSWHK